VAKKKAATSAKKKNPAKAKQSRSLNAGAKKPTRGAPFSDQDPERRLGDFTTAGEHARQGSRTSGIVGQTKSRNKTDKGGAKKKK
jgi:hypothetical protein